MASQAHRQRLRLPTPDADNLLADDERQGAARRQVPGGIGRVDALDALDALDELDELDELVKAPPWPPGAAWPALNSP